MNIMFLPDATPDFQIAALMLAGPNPSTRRINGGNGLASPPRLTGVDRVRDHQLDAKGAASRLGWSLALPDTRKAIQDRLDLSRILFKRLRNLTRP